MSDSEIPVKLRVQQIEVIEMYKEAAKKDSTVLSFLKTLKEKIDSTLEELESEEDEE